jgi:cytochrome c
VIGGACKKGGRKAVKDIMRGVVKKAKAAGQDVQCTSCHVDTATYLLKPNAVSDIKQWL